MSSSVGNGSGMFGTSASGGIPDTRVGDVGSPGTERGSDADPGTDHCRESTSRRNVLSMEPWGTPRWKGAAGEPLPERGEVQESGASAVKGRVTGFAT